MKIFIITLGLLIGIIGKPHYLFAQCDTISKTIRTDPANGINTEAPSRVNTFNWMQEWIPFSSYKFNQNPQTISSGLIRSPFYQDDNTITSHFVSNKDYLPQDGWELIKQDFGYGPNGQTDYPYFVLYNRYTSLLRVFITVGVFASRKGWIFS
jgi:hypothetical protein